MFYRYLVILLFFINLNNQYLQIIGQNSFDCKTDTCLVNRFIENYRSVVYQNVDSGLKLMLYSLEISKANDYTYGKINRVRFVLI